MKELEAIRDAINKWRKVVEISQPLKGDCHYPKTNAASETYDGCADDLEALLPALEKACTEIEIRTESRLSELMTMQMGKVRSLEAEVAALREPMSCTHPRACWREPSSVHPDGHCSMCVEKRLALAVARNEALEEGALAVWMIHQSAAAKLRALKRGGEQLVLAQAQVAIVDRSLGDLGDTSAQAALDEQEKPCRILALIPPADAQTLDAPDCDCPCDICGIGTGFHCCQPPCDIDPYDEIKRILKSVKADVAELDRKHQVEIADLKRQLQLAQAQVAIVDRGLGDLGDTNAQAVLDAHDAALREEIVALYQKMNGQEPDEDDAFVRAVLKREK